MKVKNMIKKIIAQNYITKSFKKNKGPHIILIGSPIHGNLGDHAISIAEEKLFNQIPDKKLIEIPGAYYELAKDFIRKKVNDNDIIVITGGGFIGTLWPNEQDMVNSIIANYCNNRIIIMPQTFYFSDSEEGSKELQKMQKLVEQHNDIHIFLTSSVIFCVLIWRIIVLRVHKLEIIIHQLYHLVYLFETKYCYFKNLKDLKSHILNLNLCFNVIKTTKKQCFSTEF